MLDKISIYTMSINIQLIEWKCKSMFINKRKMITCALRAHVKVLKIEIMC